VHQQAELIIIFGGAAFDETPTSGLEMFLLLAQWPCRW
jgi:hypothetical protein